MTPSKHAEAEGKSQRAKMTSTQLPTYWWRLRRADAAAKGRAFTLSDFHDRAVDQGALPVPWLGNVL
jgi:hypothetical protein